jgi:hypothetical protein
MNVIARIETTHLKYGALIAGQEYEIEEDDFGDQIFEKIEQPRGGKEKTVPAKSEKEG